MQLLSKSTILTTTVGLVLHVILIINVCGHICDYYSQICNYNVDIIECSCKCDYNL